jgi:hypothetical protein
MEIEPSVENKPIPSSNKFFIICSILAIYSICMVVACAGIAWGLENESQAMSANATSTAFAIATQQKNVANTTNAHATAQSQFEFIEPFDEISGRWYVGPVKQYGDVEYSIKNGVYIWDVHKAGDRPFSADFYKDYNIKDFDTYVDIKFIKSQSKAFVCAGLAYRKDLNDWQIGTFLFTICNDAHFRVHYLSETGWKTITNSDVTNTIITADWNRVEVSRQKNHYTFTINNSQAFELTDDRVSQGILSIYFEVPKSESGEVWFDNFGYQSR